jgi:hypothetical protein
LKKLEPDAPTLLRLLERWRSEALKAGRTIVHMFVAFEAGRDGFWLARWLIAHGIEAHVMHSASVAVSRERKHANVDFIGRSGGFELQTPVPDWGRVSTVAFQVSVKSRPDLGLS